MILYHGTNTDFSEIDLSKCNPYKDFGQGFYLTDNLEQAIELSDKRAKIFGGVPVVQKYEFDEVELENSLLNVHVFDKPSEEWALFVFNNRNRDLGFNHDFDIVIGPIADDGVSFLLGLYEEGTISLAALSDKLQYKILNRQYFFGTKKAIDLLRRIV